MLFYTGVSDYQDIATEVFTFTSSITNHRFNISIVDDTDYELTEYFQAGLRFVGDEEPPRVMLEPALANITIFDDDGKSNKTNNNQTSLIVAGSMKNTIVLLEPSLIDTKAV